MVLRRIGLFLHEAGFPVCFILRGSDHADTETKVATCLWDAGLRLAPEDILLVPEGWPNALLPGLRSEARCVIYAQSWAYLLSCLSQGTKLENLPVEFLAVSEPVARFVEMTIGKQAEILRPGIDLEVFFPPERDDALPISGPARIAFMPRKNKVFARQIREATDARLRRLFPGCAPKWVCIEDCAQSEVAEHLRGAHIFLSTGFPEGCPLPPLEALACGCIVVGFTGFGGWEYMRGAKKFPGAAQPLFPPCTTRWGGNGLYTADGDVPGTVFALEAAVETLTAGGAELAALRRAGRETAAAYSLEEQRKAVSALWSRLSSGSCA